MAELSIGIIVIIIITAFICEFMDSALGMGYGTILTPFLLIIGFRPMQIVPVVLLSELISGLYAAFAHNREGNVNFSIVSKENKKGITVLKYLGNINNFRKNVSLDLKIALLLAICSIVGTIAAVWVAVHIPKFWLKFYIGCLVFTMGVVILFTLNKKYSFSWRKIAFLGLLASFNKGMSGGGYGPVVTGGQIFSGVNSKNAIGITSLAEGLTCAVGVLIYMLCARSSIDWGLAPYVIIGAVLAVTSAAKSVKVINEKRLKLWIAVVTIILGISSLLVTFMSG